ncbi:MAG: glucokinase [Polymorphobacter sp.]|uniref:glucokinase n=1 Tax=Polymorphobacter sp. TaxID=1909290 RepID=UPI003A8BF816
MNGHALGAERLVVGDVGGSHARFAVAVRAPDGAVRLERVRVMPVSAHDSLAAAFAAYRAEQRDLPAAAVLAVAGGVEGGWLRFVNNGWSVPQSGLEDALGLTGLALINDLEAAGHAVAAAGPGDVASVCGPRDGALSAAVTSIIGPGTGLGVAMLVRHAGGHVVVPTEAGHIGFAPTDGIEDLLLSAVRRGLTGRVSVERLVSGPGLAAIHLALGGAPAADQRTLWRDVLDGESSDVAATLERFLAMLGGFAGDIALAQGAGAVVIAGGLGARLGARLAHPAFEARFADKGRFAARMAGLPVVRLLIDEPGLVGAARFGFSR